MANKDQTSFSAFPRQKLGKAGKTKSWAKQCIDAADSKGIYQNEGVRNHRKNNLINYQLYNGIVDKEDIEFTINPHKTVAGYIPDELPHYPIAAPKIDLLLGEELKRRFDYKVVVTNPDAISQKEEEKKSLWEAKIREIVENPELNEKQVQEMMGKFEKYLKYDWQDLKEITGTNILRHYYKEYHMDYMFNQGFKDVLISAEEIYQAEVIAREPVINKLNPLGVHVIRSGGSNWIQDSDLIILEDYWSPGRIMDTFHEDLTSKQVDRLEEGFSSDAGSGNKHTGAIHHEPDIWISGDEVNDFINLSEVHGSNYGKFFDTNGNVRVLRVYWRSLRKVQLVTFFDEDGVEQTEYYPEDYIPNEDLGETSKIQWLNEWWEGTKIGDDIYLKMRPKPIQYNRLDNPSKCSPGIVGYIYSTNQFKAVSLMDRMKQYQYLYDTMKDRLNKALAKYLGPLLELDLAKVPENWKIEKWLNFAVANGIAVVDSFKEGNKGAATGKLAGGMNTTGKVLNIELGNYIQQHIGMLEWIKGEMGEIVGINKQREGQVSNRETVGGVERAVNQSSHITEELFMKHDMVKVEVLKIFLETAKFALKNRSKKVQYILGDESINLLKIDGEDFAEADYGILVSVNNKYQELDQILKQLAHAGIQNDKMDFSTLMSIYMSDSLSDVRRKIEEKEVEKAENDQQRFESEQQVQQQQIEANLSAQEALMIAEEGRNVRDNQTKIQVALINAQKAMDEGIVDKDGLDNEIDIMKHKDKLKLEMDKLNQDMVKHNDNIKVKREQIASQKARASSVSSR
tara:strand:+ start:6455 stop:8842 length:2388 start_codon:yes stop_codon:yes gene_type:complete